MTKKIDRSIDLHKFKKSYWLKSQLLEFCRENSLSTSGKKEEIANRIEKFLRTGESESNLPSSVKIKTKSWADPLNENTVIEVGHRCSQKLRDFFIKKIGPHFHFNQFMRDYIYQQAGKTLKEAIEAWKDDQQNSQKKEIEQQFEYNRHIRSYFKKFPNSSLREAIEEWNKIKRIRNSD